MAQPTHRAIIYCRISRDKEGAGLGVERQREDCEQLARNLGWSVVAALADNDISAYSGKPRPGYRRLLEMLRAGEADAVLAWHTDRLHRSPVELEDYIAVCEAAGAPTVTVKAGHLDLASPSGRMVARQLGVVARYEVEHQSERRRRSNLQAATDPAGGRDVGGKRPFGWEADKQTLREAEARAIDSGSDGVLVGVSIMQIMRDWNAAGLRTTGGREWDQREVRRVLLRPRNAGIKVYQGEEIGPAAWLPALCYGQFTAEQEAEWRVEAMRKFRAVQAVLLDPARRTSPGPEPRWLGTNLYRCGLPVAGGGVCGRPVTMGTSGNGTKVRRTRPAYRCGGTARHVVRDAVLLDAYVQAAVVQRLARPDAAQVRAAPRRRDKAAELHIRAATIRTRIGEWGDMLDDGEIDKAEYLRRKAKLEGRLEALQQRIDAVAEVNALDGLAGNPDIEQIWPGLPLSRRRAATRALVTVTILPAPKGRPRGWRPGDPYFSGDHVDLDWQELV